MFENYGFIKIFPEEMSAKEQIKLFDSAEMVVGPNGAAWSNIVFANNKTKALCWAPKLNNSNAVFQNLADVFDVELRFIEFETEYLNWEEFCNNGQYCLKRNFFELGFNYLFGSNEISELANTAEKEIKLILT